VGLGAYVTRGNTYLDLVEAYKVSRRYLKCFLTTTSENKELALLAGGHPPADRGRPSETLCETL
jgi:hypothetical protein